MLLGVGVGVVVLFVVFVVFVVLVVLFVLVVLVSFRVVVVVFSGFGVSIGSVSFCGSSASISFVVPFIVPVVVSLS